MTVEQLVRDANTQSGSALGALVFHEVREALRTGESRDHLIAVVTGLYEHLEATGRDDDQDAIADVLDSLTGFCSPTATL